MIEITHQEARKLLLTYQRLYNPRQLESDEEIVSFIQKIGCIQYDPLNTIARNADLVLQSRCKHYEEDILYRLLYEKRKLLDGWDKNMSIWWIADWPFFRRKRNEYIKKYKTRAGEFGSVKKEIRKKIRENGYITSKEVNGNLKVHWSWAPTDIGRAALESMYHCGELVIHHKEGTRKFYGLAKNLLPASILNKPEPNRSLGNFHDWYVKRRIGAIGLLWNKSGDAWLGTHLKKEERSRSIKRLLDKDEILELKIANLDETFYLRKQELKILEDRKKQNEASVIAPLDNLIWDRRLISEIFKFDYKWEVYTPMKQRKYGYYVLPVVHKERFIGRFEPIIDREKRRILIQNWWWEKNTKINTDMEEALIRCFNDFAKFLKVKKISASGNLKRSEFNWLNSCVW